MSPVKLQYCRKLDGIKNQLPILLIRKKFMPKQNRLKTIIKTIKIVIDQKQLEELAVRIDIVIFRVVS